MFNKKRTIVRPVKKDDEKQIYELVQFGAHVHQHLDWRQPGEWIEHMPFFVLEWNYQLISALACSQDPMNSGWIRLFAANSMLDVKSAWNVLWSATKDYIQINNIQVAAIASQKWFEDTLEESGFRHIEDVVLLEWRKRSVPAPKVNSDVSIRDMTVHDLPEVHMIDQCAFEPLWQHSKPLLEIALLKSSLATVALVDDVIVGYQISTANASSGHLARLAVHPGWQGLGIGYSLVHHMLSIYDLWGTLRITVNTQAENIPSLSLYQKAGFLQTDKAYPVYQFVLKKTQLINTS
jgi:ribosomal protein S18 acetylase RimI-like enzyme